MCVKNSGSRGLTLLVVKKDDYHRLRNIILNIADWYLLDLNKFEIHSLCHRQCVVCFPVSEAIVEPWVIGAVISDKVAFKESYDKCNS